MKQQSPLIFFMLAARSALMHLNEAIPRTHTTARVLTEAAGEPGQAIIHKVTRRASGHRSCPASNL